MSPRFLPLDRRPWRIALFPCMLIVMHNITKKEKGLGIACALAKTGEHGSWRSVETRMHQLGHYEADTSTAQLRIE